jgi:AcrR family transcriptional regulator
LELLGTQGWQATTVTAICQRARLTPRYFYENFSNRDALLLAVFDAITEETTQAILTAIARAPDDARAKMHAAIAAVIELITADPRKGRVAFQEALGSEALMRRRFETLHALARLFAVQFHAAFNPPVDADRLVDLAGFMLVGGLLETLVAWLEGTLESTKDQLIEDCTDLVVATVTAAVQVAAERRNPPR